ncbi:unnamed protein product [Fraxinus pennsylvanica]|uniref:Uncharacterized protein n=1 Tax=Fraxinus pennsylvanica TaxID=56036 RepID=A0AAD1YUP8_9LAMI|nr:unnamed protein product [Fraxinus pennsylvanica]
MESFSKNQEEQFERIEKKLRFLSVTTKSWDQMLKVIDTKRFSETIEEEVCIEEKSQNNDGSGILLDDREDENVEKENVGVEHGCVRFSEKAHNDKQSNTEKPHRRTSFGALSENGQILTNGTKEIGELLEEFTRETDSESGSDVVEHVDNDDEESMKIVKVKVKIIMKTELNMLLIRMIKCTLGQK